MREDDVPCDRALQGSKMKPTGLILRCGAKRSLEGRSSLRDPSSSLEFV